MSFYTPAKLSGYQAAGDRQKGTMNAGLTPTSHGYGEVVTKLGIGRRLLLYTIMFVMITHPDLLVLGSRCQIKKQSSASWLRPDVELICRLGRAHAAAEDG